MGGEPKKLVGGGVGPDGKVIQGWAHYEFGKAVGDAPGNCSACIEYHRKKARILPYKGTPCRRCPKFKLYPSNYGLHPDNELAVDIYYKASGDIRVGTMDGAYLLGTLSKTDLSAVLDEYDDCFANDLERRNTFDKVCLIDQIARAVRSKDEDQQRRAARAAAQSGRKK